MADQTKDWQLYEAGKQYNNSLEPNYYDTVNANLDFFSGNQWRNIKDSSMPKPVFNIIKRVITYFVASLTTSKVKIHFEPLLYGSDVKNGDPNTPDPVDIANATVNNLLEKFKMDFKIKDALFDASVTADACAHFYFDMSKRPFGTQSQVKGEICMELVDGTNVYFGNANNSNVDIQPYIIITGRDMVKNLRNEAKKYGQNDMDIQAITSDKNYSEQSGRNGQIEVNGDDSGKALYIIVYRKKKIKRPKKDDQGKPMTDDQGQPITEDIETIVASKSVENVYIYQDLDTGLSHYPIAWMNWEKVKNSYHGRAVCTGMLPNQIFINRMFAMVMYHLMMTAFPKIVYNSDMLDSWNNEIGSAIPVKGLGNEANVQNVAQVLNPADMSPQIQQVIDLAMSYTKDTLGVSDVSLGNTNPDNTSAIIAIQKSAAVPLENPKANLYGWIEDIGKILFDMIGTYYGLRPVTMDINGQKQTVQYDYSQFKDLWLNVSADVGEASYWSEIASQQTLSNLLTNGQINIVQYLERVPDEYIPHKEELIAEIRQGMQQQQEQAAMAAQGQQMAPDGQPVPQGQPTDGQLGAQQTVDPFTDFTDTLAKLPKNEQKAFFKKSKAEQLAIIQQHMSQGQQQGGQSN